MLNQPSTDRFEQTESYDGPKEDLKNAYSGKFAEKKLIKPDYRNSSTTPWQNRQEPPKESLNKNTNSNSPWQQRQEQTTTKSSSPWELADQNARPNASANYDGYASSASAYGANPAMTRRPRSANTDHQPPRPYVPSGSKSIPTTLSHHANPPKPVTRYVKDKPSPKAGFGLKHEVYISKKNGHGHDENTPSLPQNTSRVIIFL